jgi:hypothetical protein
MHAVHLPSPRRAAALAAALTAAALSTGCAALDDETDAEVELAAAAEPGALAPNLDPAQPPPLEDIDTSRMIVDEPGDTEIEELNVRLEPPPEAQILAQPQGEYMTNLAWTDVWGGWTRAFWGNGSRAGFYVYVPSSSWRHINVAGWASQCSYAPWLTVYYHNCFGQSGCGGGAFDGQIGAGYGSYYMGTAYLRAGWNWIELTMSGDQYQAGVCDANILVDYVWIP